MRILDLIANTPKGQVKLQSTLDVKDLYFLIKIAQSNKKNYKSTKMMD